MKNYSQLTPRRLSLALKLALGVAVVACLARAADIVRSGSQSSSSTASSGSPSSQAGTAAAIAKIQANAQDRLAKTTAALQALTAMQQAARAAAKAAASSSIKNLAAVPNNSWNAANGLRPAAAIARDASLWSGARAPVETRTTQTDGTVASTVTIQQTSQQAVLNWDSFSVGKTTTLVYDQSAGGSEVGNWIAFNKVSATGSPSQILGSIKADGQVYIVNPNGILFGSGSQVNTHALVASTLPINDNLINQGLLNNPDAQFLFSALALQAGTNGTPAFTPTVTDSISLQTLSSNSHALAFLTSASTSAPVVSVGVQGASGVSLVAGTDYNLVSSSVDSLTKRTSIVLTDKGLAKAQAAGSALSVVYTPAANQYGNVEVQEGATLTAPTNSDHSGGRIALVGPNVSNAGTLSADDGQAILAAGLQVGFDAHPKADATLRGLDTYIGAVSIDSSATGALTAGVATNQKGALIQAKRGAVTIAGAEVDQLGTIDSSTSVSYNGRVDLLADYNAVSNAAAYNAANRQSDSPPLFASKSTGVVTLGASSVTQILPELDSTDRVVGTSLALPSLINIEGLAIHLASGVDSATGKSSSALILAPAADKAKDNSGSVVSQNGAHQLLTSGVTLNAGEWSYAGSGTSVYDTLVNDRGQIYLDAGASIDVSGSQNVAASVTENIVSVQLRGTELADHPLQRDGALRGETVQVDIRKTGKYGDDYWVGTPLAETSGYVGLVQRTVGELTTSGGTVSLAAGNSVVMQKGSSINVSGGWINYAGGTVQTTQVVSGGRIYDISEATPDRVYDGVASGTTSAIDPKWGVKTTSGNSVALGSRYEEGYVQGGSGGGVSLTAPAMALDGSLSGNTVSGAYQQSSAASLTSRFSSSLAPTVVSILAAPKAAELDLLFQGTDPAVLGTTATNKISPTTPNIVFQDASASQTPVAAFSFANDASVANYRDQLKISGARGQSGAEIDLSPSLVNDSGFGILNIDVSGGAVSAAPATQGGKVTLPKGASLDFAPLVSSLSVKAANIDIEGAIVAPGGSVSLTAYDVSPLVIANTSSLTTAPAIDTSRGKLTLGSASSISAAGLIQDDSSEGAVATNGGAVALSGFDVEFKAGSSVDVSGGALVGATNKITYGKGGALSILAGADPGLGFLLGGSLSLDLSKTSLLGYGGPNVAGASLTIQAPLIQIGGSSLENGDTLGRTLWLNPTDKKGSLAGKDFFSTGGFGSYKLKGLGTAVTDAQGKAVSFEFLPAIWISSGTADAATGKLLAATKIAPVAQDHVLVSDPENPGGYVFGLDGQTLAEGQRYAVSLAFSSGTIRDGSGTLLSRGDIVMNAGSSIVTDAQTDSSRGVSFSGSTVALLGSVSAPGGTLSVSGATTTGTDGNTSLFSSYSTALPTVVLGSKSALSARGKTVHTYNSLGLDTGMVLDGGTINVSGNIVAEKGASLDVSGWTTANDGKTQLDYLKTYTDTSASTFKTSGSNYAGTVVESDAGTISVAGGQELYWDATLLGAAGGASATGGTLSVSSGRYIALGSSQTATDLVLEVGQGDTVIPSTLLATGRGLIGTVVDADGDALPERGHIGADSLATKTTKASDGTVKTVQGGFDNIAFGTSVSGRLQFDGSMSIKANRQLVVRQGVITVQSTPQDSLPSVVLSAPYVSLGAPYAAPTGTWTSTLAGTAPTFGNGTLTINASTLIDVGDLSLQNIGKASFNAASGDIRGYGTLDIAGNLELTAAQIYPPTASHFTIVAYDYNGTPGSVTIKSPAQASLPQLPLSAGGHLSVFASNIVQSGVLRAPLGEINLGWDGKFSGSDTAAYTDPSTKSAVPIASNLSLTSGSVTSVSGADTLLGLIPYGLNVNGTSWIDPTGTDITLVGAPTKAIQLSAKSLNVGKDSTVDISGGGDLYAYQWVPGTGGSSDALLNLTGSFAIIPGYAANYAPLGGNNVATASDSLGGDSGYVNGSLKVGDQVYLAASNGLSAGYYTLLPARYALLPGAYLVTPQTGAPSGTSAVQVDGSSVVSGYLYNNLVSSVAAARPLYQSFLVEQGTPSAGQSGSTATKGVRSRSEYADYSAVKFLNEAASNAGYTAPRSPSDAGQLVLEASSKLALQGEIAAQAATGGKGGLVDISSPVDILVGSSTSKSNTGSMLVLDPAELTKYGAESLLIGGVRKSTTSGLAASASVENVIVDNAGSPLQGSDVVLLAKKNVTLADGASIGDGGKAAIDSQDLIVDNLFSLKAVGDSMTFARGGAAISLPSGTGNAKLTATSAGTITAADGTQTRFLASNPTTKTSNPFSVAAGSTITLDNGGSIGYASTTDSTAAAITLEMGDGAVVRVSSDPGAKISRATVASLAAPTVQIGAGSKISAANALIDSTYATTLNASVDFSGSKAVSLGSGRISAQLAGAGALRSAPDTLGNGLVLSSGSLQSLMKSVSSLSLTTYSSLDLYGSGTIGADSFSKLALHTPEIYGDGGSVTFAAKNIVLDNSTGAAASDPTATTSETKLGGTLLFKADTIDLGENTLTVERYQALNLQASSAVFAQESGMLATQGSMTLTTPQLSAKADSAQSSSTISSTLSAAGDLRVVSAGTVASASSADLGAKLALEGASVFVDTAVWLPSGSLNLHASGDAASGDVTLGASASLRLGGVSKTFNDVVSYTNAGSAVLRSEHGNVVVKSGASVDLSALKGGGDAGSLEVVATEGTLAVASATFSDAKGAAHPTFDASNGSGGSFSADLARLDTSSGRSGTALDALEALLSKGHFSDSQTIRVRAEDVFLNSTLTAHNVSLSSDKGSVVIQGKGIIDASGATGGAILLSAGGSVVLNDGATLTVKGKDFDSAGKGGSVSLEAGASANGIAPAKTDTRDPVTGRFLSASTPVVDIQKGSTIDLSVTSLSASSASEGKFSGTLHLRAPQTVTSDSLASPDVQIDPLAGNIVSASSIVVEGYKTYLPIAGNLESVEALIDADGRLFANGANAGRILASLTTGNASLQADTALFHVRPGAEVVGSLSGTGATETSLSLSRSGTKGDTLSVAAGGSVYLPAGTASASNKLTVDSSATTTIQTTQGGTLSFPNSGTTTLTTLRGCTVTRSGSDVSTAVPAGATVSVSKGDVVTLNSAVDLVTVTSSAAFELSATGPTTVGLSKTNGASGSLAFSSGSGSIATIVSAASYANTGTGTATTLSPTGNLALSTNWDLSTFRYGSAADSANVGSGEAGILTLRAAGNLVFNYNSTSHAGASLSDGFNVAAEASSTVSVNNSSAFWTAKLLAAGSQSWAYRLVAGADLSGSSYRDLLPLTGPGSLASGSGSVLLGKGGVAIPTLKTSGTIRNSIIPQYYQTIRTGTGDIDVYAGRDVKILNPLATIYTAGTQAGTLAGFDTPLIDAQQSPALTFQSPAYPAQYSLAGGNVTIFAQNDIGHFLETSAGTLADSTREMPTNWLYRRGLVGSDGKFATTVASDVGSTSWWIDFSNFFEGVGALGGGNVTLVAGRDVSNVDAVAPTNMRVTGKDSAGNALSPSASTALELGGGDLTVSAGRNIDGGVYYVENGTGVLEAGNDILTNATRSTLAESVLKTVKKPDSTTWLPTTLFLGKGSFDVSASGDVLLGSVANPFLLPQGIDNGYYYRTYFSTFASDSSVSAFSAAGDVTLKQTSSTGVGTLYNWYTMELGMLTGAGSATYYFYSQPWLSLAENSVALPSFQPLMSVMPPSLSLTAFSGDINLMGTVTLAPSETGTLDLLAGDSINGFLPTSIRDTTKSYNPSTNPRLWATSIVNVSDADPDAVPGIFSPVGLASNATSGPSLKALSAMFSESGSTGGKNVVLQTQQLLHGSSEDKDGDKQPLHYGDSEPIRLYALGSNEGDISGLTLYTPKETKIAAARDITDIAFYIQNVSAEDISVVSAGRDIVAYDAKSALRLQALSTGASFNTVSALTPGSSVPNAGDIQVSGPGTLEVLAGEDIDLGRPSFKNLATGLSTGITSIGAARNPLLSLEGANLVVASGIDAAQGLANSSLDFAAFVRQFLNPDTAGTNATRYLPELGTLLGLASSASIQTIWKSFNELKADTSEQQDAKNRLLLDLFYLVLRDTGRDRNDPEAAGYGTYDAGMAAIKALFGDTERKGNITLSSREIATQSGGDISLLAPGGSITVGLSSDKQTPEQGILTMHGGNISVFAKDSIGIGTSRVFTLRGGNEILWSTEGNIAAGSGSKTVHSAPPTRVLINPQSGNVINDLAGLATGSGIGVLATLKGVKAGDVDLIAPTGTIDAGDAGIRSSGNLNLAAQVVLNANNIQAGGSVAGAPPAPSVPNLGSLAAASSASVASSGISADTGKQAEPSGPPVLDLPSIFVVEVVGYGGDNEDDETAGADKP